MGKETDNIIQFSGFLYSCIQKAFSEENGYRFKTRHPLTRVRENFHFKGARVLKRRLTLGLHPSEEGAKGAIRVQP